MNGSGRVRRRRSLLWLAPVVLASIAVPAGRSDAAEGKVSPTTVVEGLKTIQQGLADAVAAGSDTAKAHEAVEAVEPVWALIEDTVKGNDERSYTSFEKGIEDLEAAIKAGDASTARGAVSGFASAVTFYVAKFPATGAAAAPAPAPASAPASASASASASAPASAPASTPARTAAAAPAADRPAAAAPKADASAAAPAGAGDATLARTGSASDALAALAGLALALGGLSVVGGARRRPSPTA